MTIATQRWLRAKIRDPLDCLDQAVGNCLKAIPRRLNGLDRWREMWCRRIKHFWLVNVWRGGSLRLSKPKTGNRFLDFLGRLACDCEFWFRSLDTFIFFRGRPIQARRFRVRTKSEQKVANYFDDHGIHVLYEKPVQCGRVVLHPDFYFPRYGVYVEYWGMSGRSPRYDRIRQNKLALYQQHGIPVISIESTQLSGLKWIFPALFKEATGQDFPERRKEGVMSDHSALIYERQLFPSLKQEESMMKTLTVGVVIVLAALVILPWSRDYLWQTRDQADNAFKKRVSIEQKIASVTEDLNKAQGFVTEQYAKVIGGQRKLAEQEATLNGKERELGVKQSIFLRASDWVEKHKPGDVLPSKGRTFTYAEMCTKASDRADEVRELKANVEMMSQSCDMLRQTINDSTANAKEALRRIEKEKGELAAHEMALTTWKMTQENYAMCRGIAFDGKSLFGTRHMQAIKEEVDKMKAAMEVSSWVKADINADDPFESPPASNAKELANIKATRVLMGAVAKPKPTAKPKAAAKPPVKSDGPKTKTPVPAAF